MFKLENIHKTYKQQHAVYDVTLTIEDKEFIVLLGPSGAGKTTLLRMIAGLEKVDQGSIYLNDTCLNNTSPCQRNISMVFQTAALYPHMSVYENIVFGLAYKKISDSEIAERVEEAANLLQITNILDKKPSQLSGGEQQRVSIGRAIVHKADIMLMDEPFSNLDTVLRTSLRHELKEIHRTLGTTIVFVTHDHQEALAIADRIVCMDKGIIQQIATPEELYRYPANAMVASFIGSPAMNLFSARLHNSALIIDDLSYPLKECTIKDASYLIGIRPEHIKIVQKGNQALPFQVEHVELIGSTKLLYGKLRTHSIIIQTDTFDISTGEIYITFDERMISIFDNVTKKRIQGETYEY